VLLILLGDGDAGKDLRRLATELGLDEHVEFTGRAPDALVTEVMSTADIGLSPDPKNPLNDVSTMNKTMEYMAFELPVVAFDLVETRVSAAEAAVYARPNDVEEFADAVLDLLATRPAASRWVRPAGAASRTCWPGNTRQPVMSLSTTVSSVPERPRPCAELPVPTYGRTAAR